MPTTVAKHMLLEPALHHAAIESALADAARRGVVSRNGPTWLGARPSAWSLAADQSPFKNQGDRGTCWAFAGASALEAAYHRRFGLNLDLSEEYIFHVGKGFALNRTGPGGAVAQPVENNTSLVGFQGSADIAQKLVDCAVPDEALAPYLSGTALSGILPTLGYANASVLTTQEDYDALEFCEQHVPLIARVNCRYRATGFGSIGGTPTVEALENVLLSNREVICDVTYLPSSGGHVLTLVGFDHDRRVFQAKNSWGENKLIEIAYQNDPTFQILTGWYLTDVIDPTYVQNQACWLGNWRVTSPNRSFRLLLRRSEDFALPGQPTRLGHAYMGDGRHDVNGHFSLNGAGLTAFIAAGTGPTTPGDEQGLELQATFDFADVHEQLGTAGGAAQLSRFNTRFAAIFAPDGGDAWVARHGIDAATYQQLFDTLPSQGYRPMLLNAYSEGRSARFNAVWVKRGGPSWEAHHALTASAYQATFDKLVADGFHPVIVSGYAENGEDRYLGLFEQGPAPAWIARHNLLPNEYQAAFDAYAAQGYVPVQVNGYRVSYGLRFTAIWQQLPGVAFIGRHNLTASQYQAAFDAAIAQGYRLVWVSGYSNGGIANYAAIFHRGPAGGAFEAVHGVDSAHYQQIFEEHAGRRFRPTVVSGYGDGFYPA